MNNRIVVSSLAFFLLLETSGSAQTSAGKQEAYYVDLHTLPLKYLVAAPPAGTSEQTLSDLAEVHRIEAARTVAEIAAAKADDAEEDIFLYRSVMGEQFTADKFPKVSALSDHVHDDESVISGELKALFQRPRPYQTDKTLHPVCKLTDVHNSYPSGHSVTGYLLALTLIEMVPEKRDAILARADAYAHNRLVCGVHYRADLEASRRIAYAAFGNMMTNPKFQHDLAAAKQELQR